MSFGIKTVGFSILPFCCVLLTSCVPQNMIIEEDGSNGYVMENQNAETDSQQTSSAENSTETMNTQSSSSNVSSDALGLAQPTTLTLPQPPVQPASTLEHTGTKTSWEALRVKVVKEIEDHQRHIQQLNLKLQLIDQIATKLELTTRAQFRKGLPIIADFAIANPTSYALKDISITCDQIAPTGTKIRTHTETIYAVVGASATQNFNAIELDRLHTQTESLNCEIKNFTVHTP